MLFVMIFISSCGPIYEDVYDYSAPANKQGKRCANNCLTIQNSCFQVCNAKENGCHVAESINSILYNRTAYQSVCRDNRCSKRCEDQYRSCFINCGGEVHRSSRCVGFCG